MDFVRESLTELTRTWRIREGVKVLVTTQHDLSRDYDAPKKGIHKVTKISKGMCFGKRVYRVYFEGFTMPRRVEMCYPYTIAMYKYLKSQGFKTPDYPWRAKWIIANRNKSHAPCEPLKPKDKELKVLL